MAEALSDIPPPPPPSVARAPMPSIPEADGTRALRKVMRLEGVIGEPPNPLTDHPGTGLHAALHKMNTTMTQVHEDVVALRASRSAWAERWARVFWLVLGAAIVLAMGAGASLLTRVRVQPAESVERR